MRHGRHPTDAMRAASSSLPLQNHKRPDRSTKSCPRLARCRVRRRRRRHQPDLRGLARSFPPQPLSLTPSTAAPVSGGAGGRRAPALFHGACSTFPVPSVSVRITSASLEFVVILANRVRHPRVWRAPPGSRSTRLCTVPGCGAGPAVRRKDGVAVADRGCCNGVVPRCVRLPDVERVARCRRDVSLRQPVSQLLSLFVACANSTRPEPSCTADTASAAFVAFVAGIQHGASSGRCRR